jgi:hypothetical protein
MYQTYYKKIDGTRLSIPNTHDGEYLLFAEAIADMLAAAKDGEWIYGVEIGVLNGVTSRFLCSLSPRVRLTGIDPLIPDSMDSSLIGSREAIQAVENARSNFTFIQDYSVPVSKSAGWISGDLDFVFVDGDHNYDAVHADYEAYWPLLKPGGIMFFHDSRMYRGGPKFHVGPSHFIGDLISAKDYSPIGEAFTLTAFRK